MLSGRSSAVVPVVAAVIGLAGGLLGAYLGARRMSRSPWNLAVAVR